MNKNGNNTTERRAAMKQKMPGAQQPSRRDITERKHAESALRASEKRFAGTFEHAPIGIALVSPEGRCLKVNRALCTLLGYNEDELLARTFHDITHEEDLESDMEHVRRVLAGESHSYEMEKRYVHARGHAITALLNVALVRDEREQPLYFIAHIQDITERKLAEESLRQRVKLQEQLAHTAATVPGVIYSFALRPDGSFAMPYAGGALIEIFGLQPEAVREDASLIFSLIHPDDLAQVRATIAESARSLAPWRNEFRVRQSCGKEIWVEGNSLPAREPDGSILWHGFLQDITARKRSEATLKVALEQLQYLFDSLDDVFFSVDGKNNRLLQISPGCEKLYGVPAHAFYDNTMLWYEMIHPEDKPLVDRQQQQLFAGETLRYEYRIVRPDGEIRWVESKIKPTLNAEEQFVRLDGVVCDVTRRKQAEAESRSSRAALVLANDELETRVTKRTAALAAANEDLLANEAQLLQGNRIFTELTSLRASDAAALEEALQKITAAGSRVLEAERCSVWLYNQDHSAIECIELYESHTQRHSRGAMLSAQDYPAYFQALETEGMIVADNAHTHPATRQFSETYLTPLGIQSMLDTPIIVGGRKIGVLCCERIGVERAWKPDDRTFALSGAAICSLALESYERARAEAKARQAKEEAESANRSKSEFLSRMSHELRTPLNAILGFGQILDVQEMSARQKESLQYILKGGRHLLELINEILDISRIEAGRLDIVSEPINVALIVREVLDLVRPLASQQQIQLITEVPEENHWHVLADNQRLKQVLINLLSNAVKYNHPDGRVIVTGTLTGTAEAPLLRLAVTDTGPGLSEEEVAKLFTPFERLGAANRHIEGTGIGLVLSKSLTEAMQGAIGVQSAVGEGSTFWVEFPLAPSTPALSDSDNAQPKSAALEEESPARSTLLYIEDNLSNLRVIEMLLEELPGFKLLTAMQGSTGLDMARLHHPDLILLDLHLPDIMGDEVLRRLQADESTRDIPVVILSADATHRQIERLLAAGAKEYLTKPLDVPKLMEILARSTPRDVMLHSEEAITSSLC